MNLPRWLSLIEKTKTINDIYNKDKKFCLFIFNRATYSRCYSLIKEISEHPNMELTLVLSSSLLEEKFGKAEEYIREDFRQLEIVSLLLDKQENTELGSVKIAAMITHNVGEFLSKRYFDAVIVVADRFETLPTAMACAYMNVPIIHLQGGEVTGNIDEKVRHAVTKLSDYHFVSTDCSKKYVKKMGENGGRVFNTGCPSLDLIREWRIKRSTIKTSNVTQEKYLLCIFHPDTERIQEQYEQTKIVLEAVMDFCLQNKVKCYWYWPNPDPGREEIIRLLDEYKSNYEELFVKAINESPKNFLTRLAKARLVIGNSSVGIRECSYLGVPSINLGLRQNLRERSWNVIDIHNINKLDIIKAMEYQFIAKKYERSYLYGKGKAAQYIVNHLKDINFTKKGSLVYPALIENAHDHIGESRFEKHRKIESRKIDKDFKLHHLA